MTDSLHNPGSYKDFVEQHGLQDSPEEAVQGHSAALSQYRQQLAESYGVTPEELHITNSLGSLVAARAAKLTASET